MLSFQPSLLTLSSLSNEEIGKRPIKFHKEEPVVPPPRRYPLYGPLDINDYKKYLKTSQEFFAAHAGKLTHEKVHIDQFKILHVLGRGSFGTVVLATYLPSDSNFSIKILSKERLIKYSKVKHIHNEKTVLQGLNCPFTIYLVYFFMNNSYLHLVMPYIEGEELFDYLDSIGRVSEEQARFYTAQVVLGLEYLHSLDVLYRDLKPENIIVDRTGYLKLVDFGSCKVVKSQRTYTLCGTPEYMAPEVIMSKGYGQAADWWTVGVLVYEMVAGYTPFHHPNQAICYEMIATNSYAMSERFSTALKDLIKKLLEGETSKRFGNLKGGVNDIKNHKWFRTVNWLAVLNRKITPEFIPKPGGKSKRLRLEYTVDKEDNYAHFFKEFEDDNSRNETRRIKDKSKFL